MKILAKDLTDGKKKALTNIDVTASGLMTTADVYGCIGLNLSPQGSCPANIVKGLWLNNADVLRFYNGSLDYAVAHSGTTLAGDVTGTLGATVVGNDSHSHGNGTLTGVPGAGIDTHVNNLRGTGIDAGLAPADKEALVFDSGNVQFEAEAVGNGHVSIFPMHYSAVVQGPWNWLSNIPNQALNGYFENSGIDNDEVNYKIFLSRGTWTLKIWGVQDMSGGLLDVKIDASTVAAGLDFYNIAGPIYDNVWTTTNITVATSGLKTLTLYVNGTNGASYRVWVSAITLFRTV